MADPQQGQPPMSETIPGVPGGSDPLAMMRAYFQAQQQMGPNLSRREQQPTQQQTNRPTDYAASAGGQKASLKDFSNSVQNVIGQITQKVQQRKATEQQHVFDRFTQSIQGIQQAQQQLQEAQEAVKDNPSDQQAIARMQQANQALQQNRTILDAMFNGAHGDKYSKMLSKGFGIDDKNKDTPERQQAIQALKKSMGVGDRAAGLISQIPMTAQGQGIKPPTGGQILQAEGRSQQIQSQQAIARLRLADQRGMRDDQLAFMAERDGMKPAGRGPDGIMRYEEMSAEERAKIPRLASIDDARKARADLEREQRNAMMNPKDPTFKMRLMDAYANSKEADARMKMADAAADRVLIAKMKGEGEPKGVTEARKAVTDLSKQISAHQLAMSQQNAGFFGSDKYDANRAQAALATLEETKKQKQAIIDAYDQGQKAGAASTITDEEILSGVDALPK